MVLGSSVWIVAGNSSSMAPASLDFRSSTTVDRRRSNLKRQRELASRSTSSLIGSHLLIKLLVVSPNKSALCFLPLE